MSLNDKLKPYSEKLSVIADKYDKICIQAPAGLKREAILVSDYLKKRELITQIVSEPSYGACDLAIDIANRTNSDCLVHLGHSPFYKQGKKVGEETELPIYFLEIKPRLELESVLKGEIEKVDAKKIGVVGTVQHLKELDKVKEMLEKKGKRALIGKKGNKTKRKGQVLGCDSSSAAKIKEKVDAFLVVASGEFHALNVLKIGKPVYRLDPYERRIEKISQDKIEREKRKRISKVLKYKDEDRWGIIASSKPGQYEPWVIDRVKGKLKKMGKDVQLFIGDRIIERDLTGFDIDIWVNTACPRLREDFNDLAVINPQDLKFLKENK